MSVCAVVVVSFNTCEVLRACLASTIAAGAHEIVVADNGSVDSSVEMVLHEFPAAALHVDSSNPGYGSAANAGIARTHAEYVLLLNSDTRLASDALPALTGYLDAHPRAAIVGPRLVNPDGTLQRSCHQFPTPLVTLLEYSWIGKLVGRIPLLRIAYVASFGHHRARRIDWVTGAALAIRRRAFDEVGGFDPAFFMYYEEVDLSYRLARKGWETHFAPVTDVIHMGAASTAAQSDAMYAQQIAAGMQYYRRHHRGARAAGGTAAFRFAIYSNLAGDVLNYVFARTSAKRHVAARAISAWRLLLLRLRGASSL